MKQKVFRLKTTNAILSKKVCSHFRDILTMKMNKQII